MKKQELEKELEKAKQLMKDVVYCLNQIKNTKVDGKFKSTYEICEVLGRFSNKTNQYAGK